MTSKEWRELAEKFADQWVKEGKLEDTLLMREACALGWLSAKIETMELERDMLSRRLEAAQREISALTSNYQY